MSTNNRFNLAPVKLILLTALFLLLAGNSAFYQKVIEVYPASEGNGLFLLSLALLLYCLIVLLMLVFSLLLPTRLVVSLFLMIAAASSYYTDHLGVIIDTEMIRNILETNLAEASDLINRSFLLRLALLGLIPVILVARIPLTAIKPFTVLRYKAQAMLIVILVMVLCILPLSDHYASFFREHKPLRYYTNPVYPIYSAGKFIGQKLESPRRDEFVTLTRQATLAPPRDKPTLVVLVVGETARADRFSLNGYPRPTNPRLATRANVVSYTAVTACGTSTAVSVPCMFAHAGREQFDVDEARHTQNILDILALAGVNVLWRDNNSDSKGVAARVPYQDFKSPRLNPQCDTECRDTGMLTGLADYIRQQDQDVLIVLHQMGSHGPAYFKRYPAAFERFTPACHTLELAKCSIQEIGNAYDNTILYTDYFLSTVIDFLEPLGEHYNASLLYVSDHGESLGENGLYLHGLPYLFAPDTQTHVPVIFWSHPASNVDLAATRQRRNQPASHDALFDTLLTLFRVSTDLKPAQPSSLIDLRNE